MSRRDDVTTGFGAGVIATAVMTVFRAPISKSPPPTAWFWSKFVAGGDPEDHALPALVLHLLYGIGGGVVFGVLVGPHLDGPDVDRERTGTLLGVAYGLALSVFGSIVILGRLLDMDLDADERFVFHLSHVIYGVTLGTWVGSRESPSDQEEVSDLKTRVLGR